MSKAKPLLIACGIHLVLVALLGPLVVSQYKENKGSTFTDFFPIQETTVFDEKPIEVQTDETLPSIESDRDTNEGAAGGVTAMNTTDLVLSSFEAKELIPLSQNLPTQQIDYLLSSKGMNGHQISKGAGTGSGLKGKGFGSVFGRKIEAKNLIVLLDISGSMYPHLENVISEIKKDFPDAPLMQVEGCSLYEDHYTKLREFRSNVTKTSGHRKYIPTHPNAYAAIKDAKRRGHDVIYWFSDFQDTIDDEAAEDLEKSNLKFYFLSLEQTPDSLKSLARKTGGFFHLF
ncbi:MAG: hypothetical protein AAFY98_09640 [Verrucomicrobiota bacterium]